MQWIIIIIIVIIWVVFKISRETSNAISGTASKKKQEEEFKTERSEKYSTRIIDTSSSLFERNKDIIDGFSKNLLRSISKYKFYQIDNITRDCINEICLAEERNDIRPNYEYLSNWKNKAPSDWVELSEQIKHFFSERKEQLEEEQEAKEELKKKEKVSNISSKYDELFNQFKEVAYRKVSTIDDYGEENWDALEKEIDVVITKVAKKEGHTDENIKEWKKYSWGMPEEYIELKNKMKESFKRYYKTRKNQPIKNNQVTEMTGIEFENHLASLLKESGFTNISGTPKTGDQGADLIAKRDGKTIVIQAKRYEGSVGNKAVQEVIGAIRFYNGDEGWVITNSTFTKSAKDLAHKNNIRLIDGVDLDRFDKVI